MAVMRFPAEISCFFGRYEISLYDHILLTAEFKTRVTEKGLMEYIEKGR